jgi:hypothetical protein
MLFIENKDLNDPSMLNTMLWVGGRSSSLCQGKFAWCGSNEILDEESITSKTIDYKLANDNMCLLLRVGSNYRQLSLEATNCKDRFKYLCEESFSPSRNICVGLMFLLRAGHKGGKS